MAQQYWFKAHHHGYGWSPNTWQGWIVLLLYLGGLVYSFLEIASHSHSVSYRLINFAPRFLILSAIILIIAYLKGEPTTWRWGDKKED